MGDAGGRRVKEDVGRRVPLGGGRNSDTCASREEMYSAGMGGRIGTVASGGRSSYGTGRGLRYLIYTIEKEGRTESDLGTYAVRVLQRPYSLLVRG